jgi:pimeloyl-ACP methyl ester carboxylesterase
MSGPGYEQEFIGLAAPGGHRSGAGGWPCQGVYYTPTGERPKVAMIATHYNVDFSQHYLADYVARRGIGFLGWNTRFRGGEAYFLLDHALVDIGVGVRWLKQVAGVETVILLGNSGGGSLMSAYQSQAVESNIRPAFGMKPAVGVDELIPADGYVALAAHPGRPDVLTNWMDGAVLDEFDPTKTDPALDLWNPDNGPPYSAEFVARYRAAQVARNQRITDWCKAELERITEAGFVDRVFPLSRTWADPRMVDPTVDPSNRPGNLCYGGVPERANKSVWGLGIANTLRTWLSMWSLETSQCRGEPHLARVTVPALVISADSDVGVFPTDAAKIADAIASTDKSLHSLPGAHYFEAPDGARDAVADLVVDWAGTRW